MKYFIRTFNDRQVLFKFSYKTMVAYGWRHKAQQWSKQKQIRYNQSPIIFKDKIITKKQAQAFQLEQKMKAHLS